MITELLPYIFGTVSLVGGIYGGLLSFGIYRPKHKSEEQKAKFDDWLKKFGTIMKICSVIMIINGGYDLIERDVSRYQIGSVKTERGWSAEDRNVLINNWMKEVQTLADKYPDLAIEYCECSVDKIMDTISYQEYVKIANMPKEKRLEEIMSIIHLCVEEFRLDIDKVENR